MPGLLDPRTPGTAGLGDQNPCAAVSPADSQLKVWMSKYGWSADEAGQIFICSQEESIKPKNIVEKIDFDSEWYPEASGCVAQQVPVHRDPSARLHWPLLSQGCQPGRKQGVLMSSLELSGPVSCPTALTKTSRGLEWPGGWSPHTYWFLGLCPIVSLSLGLPGPQPWHLLKRSRMPAAIGSGVRLVGGNLGSVLGGCVSLGK